MKLWKCYGLLVSSLHNQVFVVTDFFWLLQSVREEWKCARGMCCNPSLIFLLDYDDRARLFTSSGRVSLFLFKTAERRAVIFVWVWLPRLLLHSAVYSNTAPSWFGLCFSQWCRGSRHNRWVMNAEKKIWYQQSMKTLSDIENTDVIKAFSSASIFANNTLWTYSAECYVYSSKSQQMLPQRAL